MDSVVIYRDYGEVKLNVKKIMDKKEITINQVVKILVFIIKLLEDIMMALLLDTIKMSFLNYVLNLIVCDLDDIMYYEKPKKK